MQTKECISGSSVPSSNETSTSPQFDVVRKLADRVVQDSHELAASIKKNAEAESARLLEDTGRRAREILAEAQKWLDAAVDKERQASMVLAQARQEAVAVQAEMTKDAAQARIMVKEDIERQLAVVVGKIQNELKPSLDFLAGKARDLEQRLTSFGAAGPYLDSGHASTSGESQVFETVKELLASPVEAEGAACDPEPLEEGALAGRVDIRIAPPVNVARFLAITRSLENTPNIKVLQTSGSWTLGSVITVSLEKPLPVVNILKQMPNVAEVSWSQSPCPGSGDPGRILVTLGTAQAGTP